jgi:hypothetical protein
MTPAADPNEGRDERQTPEVLLITDTLAMGGAERQLALLCSSLAPSWRPRVWSVDGGPFADVIRESGVDVRIAGRKRRWDPRFVLDLWRTIRRVRPDVTHSWGWMASSAAIPACKVLGIPGGFEDARCSTKQGASGIQRLRRISALSSG